MATQEERVTALEQNFTSLTREIVRHDRKTDENLTILLGLVQTQSLESKRTSTRLEAMDERLDGVEQRLSNLERTSNEHTGLLHQILERLSNSR
ncbi:MAG: hypothetical protein NVS4B11_14810 [Ktedonobacteraceae bacterium]